MTSARTVLIALLFAPLAAIPAASSSAASGPTNNEGIAIWGHSMPADASAEREWFAKAHPAAFNDPATGWAAELDVIPVGPYKGERHTDKEPAAVAGIRLTGNGGRGVTSAARVATETPGATRWAKTGLFVGVEARNGVAVRLTVREAGRGYAVGDPIVIPVGAIGNAAPITGEVAAIREETIGTVRHPDGMLDVANFYSQWDVDNGYWPRCFRRDFIHFNEPGAE